MMSKVSVGNAIRLFGWLVVVFNALKYSLATFDTLTDPSVKAYAMLVVFEGLLHIAGGLLIVWIGKRLTKKVAAPGSPPDEATSSRPD
jgi:hypothetical protein